jgi:hypothetical protein
VGGRGRRANGWATGPATGVRCAVYRRVDRRFPTLMRMPPARRSSRRPILRGVFIGAACILAFGAAAWVLGYLRIKPSGVQPAAPFHEAARSAADARRLHLQIDPPKLVASNDSAARRRLVQATNSAFGELVGSGDGSPVAWDPDTGLWDYVPRAEALHAPTWWQSANALDAVVRYASAFHVTNPDVQHLLQTVYQLNVSKPGTSAPKDFEDVFMDDTAWWGIAWVDAARYEQHVLHDDSEAATFLKVGEAIARWLEAQPKRCGDASIPFRDGYTPNTITDAEFVDLVAELGQMRSGHGPLGNPALAHEWTSDAEQTLHWLESVKLINVSSGGLYRTEDNHCRPVGQPQTYTEGEVADALVQVGALTHDPTYTEQAAAFINRVLAPGNGMLANGVLQEQCEAQSGQCLGHSYNIMVYKGLFDDAVKDWTQATHSTTYDSFLNAQAQAVISNATGNPADHCATATTCQLSLYWARRVPVNHEPLVTTAGSQASGLSALVNALWSIEHR